MILTNNKIDVNSIVEFVKSEKEKCRKEHWRLFEDDAELLPIGDYGQSEWLLSRISFCDSLLDFIESNDGCKRQQIG
jgi:hypothetical protein